MTAAVEEAAALRLLDSAWSALNGPDGPADRLRWTARWDDSLPSSLPCLPAMAAAVAASALAVADADSARNGREPERVGVDVEHVAVAARSERYAHLVGQAPPDLFAPLSRLWQAADGWVRVHANYAWHKERALRVLRCSDSPDAFGAEIRRRTTEDLEESFAEAGALAFVVRSLQEWEAHPHGRAVARLPLLETTAGGRAGTRPLPPGRFLERVRVLDLTRVIAGPVATRTLAAWGADVLRLDSPGLPEIEAQTIDTLPGKRSALLDAANPEGADLLQRLLGQADVLVQGYRPGALSRFGLSSDALAERHPHLSVVTLSAWGRSGPWADRRGFDSLVQCPTGIAVAESKAGKPGALPAQVLDHATGYLAAAAGALSVAGTARGLPPRHALLSLAQTARWLQSTPAQPRDPAAGGALLDAERYMTELAGGETRVRLVRPPGDVGGKTPVWDRTTSFGRDSPSFTDT